MLSINQQTPGILVLAHLGWDFVWQRPQHILSRLARHYPVIYINEPQVSPTPEGQPQLRVVADDGNLTAYQPRFPDRADVLNNWREVVVALARDAMLRHGWLRVEEGRETLTRPVILWFYTPIPVYALDGLPHDLVVYDVMDQLANFKGAARDLPQREARLLQNADVVFTGGRSIYEARVGRHGNLHLFASGVDPTHFAQALAPDTAVAPEIAGLPHPVLGYYGVIDERTDMDLLRQVAVERPNWSIVMVGPVAKIDVHDLPLLPNIHYVGQKPYSRLPNFLKGFDVCLMPFAMNEATRYISPTKTLEYMAAHKPIVSTPVPDVVANWGHAVFIADDAAGVIQAVEEIGAETEDARAERLAAYEAIVDRNTWDYIAAEMRHLIEEAFDRRAAVEATRA
ncbi:MAG: glycosyltransferase [Anaerolineae bacterium]